MNQYLAELSEYGSITLEDYRTLRERQLAVERLIQLIVQTGIDINYQILKCLDIESPNNARDALFQIVELGILEEHLAVQLAESIKLRNLLVHLYKKIDPDIIHSSIANILRDYPRYQRSIVQYLDYWEAENG
ncbi:MAG: type VII toxin-antitoxin system HepT family RNase toxin [Microcystis sp.]